MSTFSNHPIQDNACVRNKHTVPMVKGAAKKKKAAGYRPEGKVKFRVGTVCDEEDSEYEDIHEAGQCLWFEEEYFTGAPRTLANRNRHVTTSSSGVSSWCLSCEVLSREQSMASAQGRRYEGECCRAARLTSQQLHFNRHDARDVRSEMKKTMRAHLGIAQRGGALTRSNTHKNLLSKNKMLEMCPHPVNVCASSVAPTSSRSNHHASPLRTSSPSSSASSLCDDSSAMITTIVGLDDVVLSLESGDFLKVGVIVIGDCLMFHLDATDRSIDGDLLKKILEVVLEHGEINLGCSRVALFVKSSDVRVGMRKLLQFAGFEMESVLKSPLHEILEEALDDFSCFVATLEDDEIEDY